MGRKERTDDYFGKRLKDERKLRQLSQSDLAAKLTAAGAPMHHTTVAKIEAGDRTVRIDEATAIADVLNVSLDALLGRAGMEDERDHAMTVLADQAQRAIVQLLQMRDEITRAAQEAMTQWNLAEPFFPLPPGLSHEETRAWLACGKGVNISAMLSGAIEETTKLAAIVTASRTDIENMGRAMVRDWRKASDETQP